MGDMMSLALVALLALAQINLLSPVNTPFPGRIWASDTFIFSGIWENTRGGFWHSVRRQAWAFVFWFSPCVTCEPVSSGCLNLHNAEARLLTTHFTWRGVWPGQMTLCDPVFWQSAAHSVLSQGCHTFSGRLYSRFMQKMALFCCFHTF